jgi:hypothetical protein
MTDYRLKIDGDFFEKKGWDLFVQNKFPNYEIFWINHIVPKTNRPKDIWFKVEVPDDFRIISNLHYGIFKHFLYVYENISHTQDFEMFTNLLIRLSSISDLTEEFIFRLLQWNKKIPSNESICSEFRTKSFTFEEKVANKMLSKGANYGIPVINKSTYIMQILPKYKELKIHTDESIKAYRNILIHSWSLFRIDTRVPKLEKIRDFEYRDWGKIIEKLKDDKQRDTIINEYYVESRDLFVFLLEKQITLMNTLWDEIIKLSNDNNTLENKKDEEKNKKIEVKTIQPSTFIPASNLQASSIVSTTSGSDITRLSQ